MFEHKNNKTKNVNTIKTISTKKSSQLGLENLTQEPINNVITVTKDILANSTKSFFLISIFEILRISTILGKKKMNSANNSTNIPDNNKPIIPQNFVVKTAIGKYNKDW